MDGRVTLTDVIAALANFRDSREEKLMSTIQLRFGTCDVQYHPARRLAQLTGNKLRKMEKRSAK